MHLARRLLEVVPWPSGVNTKLFTLAQCRCSTVDLLGPGFKAIRRTGRLVHTASMSEEDFTPVSGSVEADEEEAAENENIEKAMVAFMRKRFEWSNRELHDALLAAGVAVPFVPSMPNYVAKLYAQYGDADTGFMPQSLHSHAKVGLQRILRILSRAGAKLGGKLAEPKAVLAHGWRIGSTSSWTRGGRGRVTPVTRTV